LALPAEPLPLTGRDVAAVILDGRIGHAKVDSEGDGPGQTQFGPPQSRSFTPFSAAVGGIYNLST